MSVTKQLLLERNEKGKRRAGSGGRVTDKVDWVGFVSCELTAAHKDDLAAGVVTYEEAWDEIDALLYDRYKLSIVRDDAHDCYVVSLTCNKVGDSNAGLTLSARGGTMVNAVRALIFKHRKIMDGDWAAWQATPRRSGVDFG